MNEPTELRTEIWLEAANDSIAKIRRVGAKNLILVPGNGWSSARDWMSGKYGTPNATVMLNVVDPDDNFAFDVHQLARMLTAKASRLGSRRWCRSTIGRADMASAVSWVNLAQVVIQRVSTL